MPLPVIDSVADFIYEHTPCPETIGEAERRVEEYELAITDIRLQLSIRDVERTLKTKQADPEFSEVTYLEWQLKTLNALRIKEQQKRLLLVWIKEQKPAIEQVVDRVQEQIRNVAQMAIQVEKRLLLDPQINLISRHVAAIERYLVTETEADFQVLQNLAHQLPASA